MAAMLGLGLGFVEVGSVTPRPQPGNPRPRIFRLPEDGAVLNRLGFNNAGLEAACSRLRAFRATGPAAGPVGANPGTNRDTVAAVGDYVLGAAALGPLAAYRVVNASSPTTPAPPALQGRTAPAAMAGARPPA